MLERWNKQLGDQNNHGWDRGKHLSPHKAVNPWNSVGHGEELSRTQKEMRGKGGESFQFISGDAETQKGEAIQFGSQTELVAS